MFFFLKPLHNLKQQSVCLLCFQLQMVLNAGVNCTTAADKKTTDISNDCYLPVVVRDDKTLTKSNSGCLRHCFQRPLFLSVQTTNTRWSFQTNMGPAAFYKSLFNMLKK